jgi:hypothetical protein
MSSFSSAHARCLDAFGLFAILRSSLGPRNRPMANAPLSPPTAPTAAAATTSPRLSSPDPARAPAEITDASLGTTGKTASSAATGRIVRYIQGEAVARSISESNMLQRGLNRHAPHRRNHRLR